MDYCSTRKYSDYSVPQHPMARRVGEAILSAGPPNRLAPNVTVVGGHRHQHALRFQEHQHRLATLQSTEGLYQQHGFERFHPAGSYSGYHPASYVATGLSYGNLERRDAAAYLNHHAPHSQHSHHLYHPPHYDSTYNGRMIGGAGVLPSIPFRPYRDSYEQQGVPSSILHYTARNSAFQYSNSLVSPLQNSQQREYLPFYPYSPYLPEQRYVHSQHNLQSINELHTSNPTDDGRTKKDDQNIKESEASYAQQQQPHTTSLSAQGVTMIASPMVSGSTTNDSGISGSSRCGSTPISMVNMSTGYSGEYSLHVSSTVDSDEKNMKRDSKSNEKILRGSTETVDDGKSSLKDQRFSPNQSSCIKSLSSPSENEKEFSHKRYASSQRTEGLTPLIRENNRCETPLLPNPERCGTPFITNSERSGSLLIPNNSTPIKFQPSHPYQNAQEKWYPTFVDSLAEAPPNSPQPYSPNSRKKRKISPARILNNFEEKKNRVVECDLIPDKKSKRNSETPHEKEVREEIRDIKPLPGFQQAFGSTEIGRFFETFLNIPSSPYDYESDTFSPQSWDIENSIDGSPYDVQISASLQPVYKHPLGDKNYLNGIRCNGY